MDQRRLDELKCDAYSIGARDLSGMPKSQGFSTDGGKTARYATEIADLEEIILVFGIVIFKFAAVQAYPEALVTIALTQIA